jgi:hypothetical protein
MLGQICGQGLTKISSGLLGLFVKIGEEQRTLLCHGFISLSSDFVTDSVRRESYGCVIADLVANKFEMADGRVLFMSRDTAARIVEELLTVSLF